MRVYLIDGHSLLYRAFYALPPSIATSSGLPTNALYGFVNMLFKLLQEDGDIGVGVVWDTGLPKFRTEVYAEYKAQRSAMPGDLKVQLDHMDEILEAMNIPVIRSEGFEADDVIATLTRRLPEDIELVIVTGDQDAMQLADGNVKVLRTTRGISETKLYGREDVIEGYGVTPEQIPDYKALTGDTSDNIPGVKGIGPKSAVNLLKDFGTVENLYGNLDKVTSKALRKKLEEGRESAFTSLELARMRFDAPVELDPEALRFHGISPGYQEVLRRYEFRSLESKFAELPIAGAKEAPRLETVSVRVSTQAVEQGSEPVAVYPIDGQWCIALSEDAVHLTDKLPQRPLLVHDAKRTGVREAKFDTYLAGYLVQPGDASYEPRSLADGRGLPGVRVEHEDRDIAAAAERAALTCALAPVLAEELEEKGLSKLYYEVELPLADVLADMELVGMPVDAGTLIEVGKEIESEMHQLEADIYREAGHEFNINSTKQLAEVLFVEMDIPTVRKTKTGYSTDARVLQQLALEYPIAEQIIRYRELAKLKGTYTDGLLGLIGEDGRIHTTMNQAATATGRISSDSPNLQNIPIRTELGTRIRDAFTASAGRKLVIADYSQIELRILAHMCREPALVEAFNSGEDVHTRTAAEVFDVHPEDVTPELRRRAKMVNFGILYGISGFGLATRLGNIPLAEAELYIKRYLERYPKVTEFITQTLKETEELGYVTTLFGRRRYVPELKNPNRNVRKLGERIAFNARVQGSAADIIKVAMVDIHPRLPSFGADMLMQVHDELVFDVDLEHVDEVARLVSERMAAAYHLDPPLEVEVKVGDRWGNSKMLALE